MEQLTTLAQNFMRERLTAGDSVIDATAGNGWDTLFLAKSVGESGKVYAFDIQYKAIQNTRELLIHHGITNVTLIQGSHAEMQQHIPEAVHGQVAGVMLNLGYLPGGDKTVTTNSESTLQAFSSLSKLLKPQGRVTIIAYPGHAKGAIEVDALEQVIQIEPIASLYVVEKEFPLGKHAPKLYLLEKNA